MQLSDKEAEELLNITLDRLKEMGATDLLSGINESFRLGIEEAVDIEYTSIFQDLRKFKEVSPFRKRPLDNREKLEIVLKHLFQRLVVLPTIGKSILEKVGAQKIKWLVDTEFLSTTESSAFESDIESLRMDDLNELTQMMDEIHHLIPDLTPFPQGERK
jgi:hypothetical protein